jgi:CRP/FNR family cyclic AMP-dependent transcriptional regulator
VADGASISVLQNMPIFGGVSEAALAFLLQSAEHISRATNEYFFQEGELADSMYVIEWGQVVIHRQCDGKQYKLRELVQGDCFGEMALMDCKSRSASAQALEPCQAIQIRASLISDLYGAFPEQFTLIQMNMGREVCRRLREADKRLFKHAVNNNEYPERS